MKGTNAFLMFSAGALLSGTVSEGSVCSATHYLQGGTLYATTLHLADQISETAGTHVDLHGDMIEAEPIDTGIDYAVLLRFTPECNAWTRGRLLSGLEFWERRAPRGL